MGALVLSAQPVDIGPGRLFLGRARNRASRAPLGVAPIGQDGHDVARCFVDGRGLVAGQIVLFGNLFAEHGLYFGGTGQAVGELLYFFGQFVKARISWWNRPLLDFQLVQFVERVQHLVRCGAQLLLRSILPLDSPSAGTAFRRRDPRNWRMSRQPPSPQRLLTMALAVAAVALLALGYTPSQSALGQSDVDLRVLGAAPLNWDPARIGDATSATVVAQVFDGLTMLDPTNNLQPALASSWTVSDDGQHVDFTMRAGTKFSDGTTIAAQDVVDSWFRLIDPSQPSPLVSLMSDVTGVNDYLAGKADRRGVGLHAQGDHVLVDLARPATYFVSVASSPSLAVVPHSMFDSFSGANAPANPVVSGAYRPTSMTDTTLSLEGNASYWGGAPRLNKVEVVLDTGGQPPIDLFEAGQLDYTQIDQYDAAWAKFDPVLGPELRQTNDLDVQYYGFDTRSAPFNDSRVREAFVKAVDWDRIVTLGDGDPAHSMVPPGMPNFDSTDYRPTYDPAGARDLLKQAGFDGGAGFPEVALTSIGFGYEAAVAAELEQQLGIKVDVELYEFGDLLSLQAERPAHPVLEPGLERRLPTPARLPRPAPRDR